MPYVTEENLTDIVMERWKAIPDPRLKEVMQSLIKHLHAFVRDVEPGELLPERAAREEAAFLDDLQVARLDLEHVEVVAEAPKKKRGFGCPVGAWFRSDLRPLLRDPAGATPHREQPVGHHPGASTHEPAWLTWRLAATRSASARRSWSMIETVSLTRSPGDLGLVYQSVTITPPLESACSRGANDTVSIAARHR